MNGRYPIMMATKANKKGERKHDCQYNCTV